MVINENELKAPSSEFSILYEAPRLEYLGKLGEIVRGTSGTEFDYSTTCATAGHDADDLEC